MKIKWDKVLKVSILETGKLPQNLENKFGDYPKMFNDLFKQSKLNFEIKTYDLINKDFPKNLDNTDLWLITGSSYGVYENVPWISKLKNLDVLVINALRREPHSSHFSLKEALNFIQIVKPKKAYLTHLSHHLGFHDEVEKTLPKNIYLSYDGLEIII